jgi:hypothetical protein
MIMIAFKILLIFTVTARTAIVIIFLPVLYSQRLPTAAREDAARNALRAKPKLVVAGPFATGRKIVRQIAAGVLAAEPVTV